MSFYIELHTAKNIYRDNYGRPYAWTDDKLIKKFTEPIKFIDYVRANIKQLKNAVAFSGSASTITTANSLITDELKKVGVL